MDVLVLGDGRIVTGKTYTRHSQKAVPIIGEKISDIADAHIPEDELPPTPAKKKRKR